MVILNLVPVKRTIVIIGCGWLGLSLADRLIRRDIPVIATRPTENGVETLLSRNITTILLSLNPELYAPYLSRIANSDIAVVLIPPRASRGQTNYPEQIEQLVTGLVFYGVNKIIFASSTSVYPLVNRQVDESEPIPDSDNPRKLVRAAELVVVKNPKIKSIVVRFAGLCGPGREPGRLLAGRKDLNGGSNPVNLIHQQDAVSILTGLIEYEPWQEIFNACAPMHPIKAQLYTDAALKLGLEVPIFNSSEENFKQVDASKICRSIDFSYSLPDPNQW